MAARWVAGAGKCEGPGQSAGVRKVSPAHSSPIPMLISYR